MARWGGRALGRGSSRRIRSSCSRERCLSRSRSRWGPLVARPRRAHSNPPEAESSFRVQRVCAAPRPGAAACAALRLVPASLSSAELQASAAAQAGEQALGAAPAVNNPSPFPGYLTPQLLRAAYCAAERNGGRADADDRRDRRVRRSHRGSGSGCVRRTVRPARVHHRERLLPQARRGRAKRARCRRKKGNGRRDLDRRADGARRVPGLSRAAGGGQQRRIRRPRRRRSTRP